MSITERSSSTKRSFRIGAPSENTLLVIVAFAILILHVLAGTLVQHAVPGEPADQKKAIVSYGD